MIVYFYFLHGVCLHYVIHFIKNIMYMSVGNSHLWSFACPFWLVPVCVQAFSTIVNVSRRETESWSGNVCRCLSCRSHAAGVVRCYGHRWRHSSLCVTGSRWSSPLRTFHVERNRATCSPTVRHSPPTAPLNHPAVSIQHRAMTLDWKRSLGASAWSFPWSTKSEFLLLQHTAKHNLLFLVNVTCIYTTNPCFMS